MTPPVQSADQIARASGNGSTAAPVTKAAIIGILETKIDPLNKSEAKRFVNDVYGKIVDRMIAANCSTEEIAQAISDLERQAKILHQDCGFQEMSVSIDEIREWLANTADGQIEEGIINLKSGKTFTRMLMIGRDEFKELLSKHNLGIITKEAFDVIFGNKDGDYEFNEDSMNLEAFTAEIKGKVLPFAGTMSSDAVYKMLLLFRAKEFILLKPDQLGPAVQDTLRKEFRARISASTVLTAADKEFMLKKDANNKDFIDRCIEDGDFNGLYKKLNELINANIRSLDERKDIMTADPAIGALFKSNLCQRALKAIEFIKEKKKDSGVADPKLSKEELQYAYCCAGLATLYSDYGSIKSHLIATGGKAKDLYKIETSNEYVTKALIKTITLFGIYGPEYRQEYADTMGAPSFVDSQYKSHIKWLKDTDAVDESMRRTTPEAASVESENASREQQEEAAPQNQ